MNRNALSAQNATAQFVLGRLRMIFALSIVVIVMGGAGVALGSDQGWFTLIGGVIGAGASSIAYRRTNR